LRTADKDPARVESGRRGALKRWGGQRIARLDALDPRVREAVLALIRADEAARASEPEKAAA
jgi:hypothetical protein